MSHKQIPLELDHQPSYALEDFLVAGSNEAAFSMLDSWPEWPHHAVALVGPEGSGKSHLGRSWALRVGAHMLAQDDKAVTLKDQSCIFIEDADAINYDQDCLFHLFNWAKETDGHLLFTARSAPTLWNVDLPDLRSRLATLPVTYISSPDDLLLSAIFIKLFSDRQLQVDLTLVDYLLPRMERSFSGALRLVDALDKAALAKKARITKILARDVLQTMAVEGE